jgi:tRNA dimethylallyltransferase
MTHGPVWIVAGPTASGKSALAADLAARINGTVINADSMQVYAEIPILSAQPSDSERASAPHVLYGLRTMTRHYSAAAWALDAQSAIHDAHNAGRQPILVGGSGLYLRALVYGFAPVPPVPEAVRRDIGELYDVLGPEKFHAQLAARDPISAARLHPTDRQRCIRAREVFEATGLMLSALQDMPPEKPAPDLTFRAVILDPDRAWLHERITQRFHTMVSGGALDEAAAVNALDPDPLLPGTRALGLAALRAHVNGTLGLSDAIADAVTQSRQYAKRQSTWFRGQKTADHSLTIQVANMSQIHDFFTGNA